LQIEAVAKLFNVNQIKIVIGLQRHPQIPH